jgi:hypothetical protein
MGAFLPTSGDANWQDNVDNWTEGDAEWLQDRLVQRISTASDVNLTALVAVPNPSGDSNKVFSFGEGRVFYNTTTDSLILSTETNSNAGLRNILASGAVRLVDAGGGATAEIRGTNAAPGSGITINKTTGAISIGGAVTFSGGISATSVTGSGFLTARAGAVSGTLVTDNVGLTLNTTGSNPVTLTTAANTYIQTNGSLRAANVVGTASLQSQGALAVTGAATLSSNLTVAGNLSATGPASFSGSGSFIGAVTTPALLSPNDLTLTPAANIRTKRPIVFGDAANNPGNIKNGWVIYDTSDPARRTVTAYSISEVIATVTTSAAHNLWLGASVTISGSNRAVLNGTFEVIGMNSTTQFLIEVNSGFGPGGFESGAATGSVAIPIPDGTVWVS